MKWKVRRGPGPQIRAQVRLHQRTDGGGAEVDLAVGPGEHDVVVEAVADAAHGRIERAGNESRGQEGAEPRGVGERKQRLDVVHAGTGDRGHQRFQGVRHGGGVRVHRDE